MSVWDGGWPDQPEEEREWEDEEIEDDDPPPESWRGDQHLEDWPEDLAGPEYWFFRRWEDDEEGGP